MATTNLEELSKSFELSLKENSPEDYIRKTLQAHGFFNHFGQKPSKQHKRHRVCGISEEDKKRTTQLISHFKEGREFHTLKEPRHLYGSDQDSRFQSASYRTLPFWPSEVECIRERITFLMSPPRHPEPYYATDHEVVSPKVRSGEGMGRVVYMNLPGPEKYYVNSRRGPSLNRSPARTASATDTSLEFESRFESGNLSKAVQVGRWDYELYLRYDLYTRKHTQWFYFRVRNMHSGQTYRFTIVNLYKAGSLYNEGMQPVFYSEKEARENRLGWHRAGHNIKYFKTPIRRLDTKQEAFCYGVTWSHTFKHSRDTCFFAHSFPYTYSDLQDYLHKILTNREEATFCKYRVLCHTIAGNTVPLLTITSPSLSPDDSRAKRGIVVTARIHPGETNGSWMMKGLLDFLTSSADDAKILRDLFVFKIIPMLNPDGVIVGNYRCSLSGRDLNRNFRSKLKDSYPTVWHTKNLVKRFHQEREVVLFCDLHGHSRKHNIFVYGCDALDDASSRLKSRVFPRMLCKNAPDMFSFNSSRFVVQKSKEGTGRVMIWREAGIQNSYTLEATFAGSTQGKLKGVQFSTSHLEHMGYHLCDTLLDYCDPDQSKTEKIMRELEDDYRKSVLSALAALGKELPPGVDPLDVKIDPALAEAGSSDAGSDSSESDGPPAHLQWKHRKSKKKKLKSRKERNKQKALLKMNHQPMYSTPPSSIPQPALEAHASTQGSKRTKASEVKEEGSSEPAHTSNLTHQSCDMLGSLPSTTQPLTHNGGIPTFVQDRLEERQRRREEEDNSEALGGVPSEQLRQALMRIHATHTQLAPSSTIYLPHPSCPMNISQVNMHDVSRRQSRLNSKVSLPQLDSGNLIPPDLPPLYPATSRGAFTSQYVAHHLQNITANPSGAYTGDSSVNNTRNLSNLSRLFRTLHHSSRTVEDRQHLKPTQPSVLRAKEGGNIPDNEPSHRQRDKTRQRCSDEAENTAAVMTTTLDTANLTGNAGGKDTGRQQNNTLKVHFLQSQSQLQNTNPPSSMKTTATADNTTSETCTGGDTKFNKYVPTSSGSLSHVSQGSSSSPMTSSWESFSRGITKDQQRKVKMEKKEAPAQVKERKERTNIESIKRRQRSNRVDTNAVVIDAHLAAEEEKYQQLVDYLTMKHRAKVHSSDPHTPVPQPVSRSVSPPKLIELPPDKMRTAAIMNHKQGIANAVANAHATQTQKRTAPQIATTCTSNLNHNTLPIPKSKSEPLPSSKTLSPLLHHVHASQEPIVPKPECVDSLSKERMAERKKDEVQLLQQRTRKVEHKGNTAAYYDETRGSTASAINCESTLHPSQDTDDGDSLLHRIYSSKPPSRFGRRPGPCDGAPPSTVSIMLSGRLRMSNSMARPTTMHSSTRKPGKHSHIHYFTKKT